MRLNKQFLPLIALFILLLSCRLVENPGDVIPTETFWPQLTQVYPIEKTPAIIKQFTPEQGEAPVIKITQTIIPEQSPLNNLSIFYIKEGDIWIWTRNSSNRKLTENGMVHRMKVSPDGQVAAFTKRLDNFRSELWAINIDGSDERRLVSVSDLDQLGAGVLDQNTAGINPYKFEWVPGSHILAFNTQQVFQGAGLTLLDDLNQVDVDSLELKIILPPGQGGHFVYAPDGGRVAISTPTDISIVSTEGVDRLNVLSYDQVNTFSEYRYYAQPVWSPDSSYLLAAIPPVDPLAQPREPTNFWHLPIDGTPAFQNGGVVAEPFISSEVKFSPDLQRILFLRETGQPSKNHSELYIAKSDGSEERVYIKAPLIQLMVWNPDSNRFVYRQGEAWEGQLGGLNETPNPFSRNPHGIFDIEWIDVNNYLILRENDQSFDLFYESLGGDQIKIDSIPAPPADFDFSLLN